MHTHVDNIVGKVYQRANAILQRFVSRDARLCPEADPVA